MNHRVPLVLGVTLLVACPAPAVGQPPPPMPDGFDELVEELVLEDPEDGVEEDSLETLTGEVDSVVAQPRYEFCHDPRYTVPFGDRHLCRLAEPARPRCEAFERACATKSAPPGDWSLDLNLPGLGVALRFVFWIAVVSALVALIATFIRNGGGARRGDTPSPSERTPTPDDTRAPARIVERDVQRLLGLAKDHAARAEFERALGLLYAALLRQLEAENKLHVTPHRTNGDYVRDLASEPELQALVRRTAQEVEGAQFGGRACDAASFAAALSRLTPLLGRAQTLVAIVIAASSSLACSGMPTALSSSVEDDGPGGYSVIAHLLEARDATVKRRIQPLDSLPGDETDTVIVLQADDREESDWDALIEWTRQGGQLVLSGASHAAAREALEIGSLDYEVCSTELSVDLALSAHAEARVVGHMPFAKLEGGWQTVVGCDSRAYVALRPLGAGQVILFMDPDFLSNASLTVADNGALALDLVGYPLTVDVVDDLTGAGAESPYLALKNSGLGLLFLQGLLLLLVLYLSRGVPFAKLTTPVVDRRRAFSEHVRAVGRLYSKSRASRYALGMYATWALDRLHERLRPGAGRSLISLAAAVAERSERPEQDVVRILVEANEAREDPNGIGVPAQDLAILRALDELVRATGGTR